MVTGLVLGFGEMVILSVVLFLLVGASGMSRYGESIKKTVQRFRKSLSAPNQEEDPPPETDAS